MASSTPFSSASFYIVLPSNTNVEGNRTNAFRVHLPRKLQFNAQWSVGLAVLVYPHSWPSLGSVEPQFVRVEWLSGEQVRIPVPAASVRNPTELLASLHAALASGSEQLANELRAVHHKHQRLVSEAEHASAAETARVLAAEEEEQQQYNNATTTKSEDDDDDEDSNRVPIGAVQVQQRDAELHERKQRERRVYADTYARLLAELVQGRLSDRERSLLDAHLALEGGGLDQWLRCYQKAPMACQFHFDEERQRFRLKLDKRSIRRVELSAQLAYILGFHAPALEEPVNVARYPPDMKGGVSTFYVYAPGLIEPVIIGDVCAPVLRVVNIRGSPDEMVEECYIAVQYHRLVVKEVSEIHIEIRTPSGTLMPFQYGTCTLTLHFKKTPYF